MVSFKKEKSGALVSSNGFSMTPIGKHQSLYKDIESNKEIAVSVGGHSREGQKFLVVLRLQNNKQEWRDGSSISRSELETIIENLKTLYEDRYGYEVVFTKPSFTVDSLEAMESQHIFDWRIIFLLSDIRSGLNFI